MGGGGGASGKMFLVPFGLATLYGFSNKGRGNLNERMHIQDREVRKGTFIIVLSW